ncbi:MAG: helix-turn-helix transcriptional regulator [Lachnospiraceae bacterium]|jgi:transcriptional regulator with XRE-family HTH domain|nr:helix-turn-helix transcriptional regulator [Lachnospiraceae bacterium]
MENRVLGQKIAVLRKAKKITSEKLAYMCSVYPGHIRQIESGVRLPSLKLFVDICNALQVSPEYLLSQELEMFEQMENADEMHKNVINKIKRLTPKELNILHSLLESYFISLESIKEQR